MVRTAKARRMWQVVGGSLVLTSSALMVTLGQIGAGEAARGLGLALFFLVWPLMFLAIAPPAKPGIDPVTAQYYRNSSETERQAAAEAPNSTVSDDGPAVP